jgi:hypothetical protein
VGKSSGTSLSLFLSLSLWTHNTIRTIDTIHVHTTLQTLLYLIDSQAQDRNYNDAAALSRS